MRKIDQSFAEHPLAAEQPEPDQKVIGKGMVQNDPLGAGRHAAVLDVRHVTLHALLYE